jgi:hypothetical protein
MCNFLFPEGNNEEYETKELSMMRPDRFQKLTKIISLLPAIMIFVLVATVECGKTAEKPEETPVVIGDDFVMTQADIEEFAAFFKSQKLRLSDDNILKTALKYELLSGEYRKNNKSQATLVSSAENSDKVATKIQEGKKYIQSVLENQDVSSEVIESYYLINYEKYSSVGTGGKNSIIPLDDALKNEIRFIIIEKKTGRITADIVESLMIKYHVKILNEG